MATGIYGEQQRKQFARELNSSPAPQVEKEVFQADLILETRISRREIIDRRKNLTKSKSGRAVLRAAKQDLAKIPGIRLMGSNWCRECGSNKVDKPNGTCHKCREKMYEVQVPTNTPELPPEIDEMNSPRRYRDDTAV